jgi:hypothetical protein
MTAHPQGNLMTTDPTVAAPATAAPAGPRLRAAIFAHSVAHHRPLRRACPRHHPLPTTSPTARTSVTGQCPSGHRRVEPQAGRIAATVPLLTARTTSWVQTLARRWAGLHGVVQTFIDLTVHRPPGRIIATAHLGTAALRAAPATGPRTRLVSAVAAADALYQARYLATPGRLGLAEVKPSLLIRLLAGWFGLTAVPTTAIVTAAHPPGQADPAREAVTCANPRVDTDTSRRGQSGSAFATVYCTVCVASLARTSGIPGGFTTTSTSTSPIDTCRQLPSADPVPGAPSGMCL